MPYTFDPIVVKRYFIRTSLFYQEQKINLKDHKIFKWYFLKTGRKGGKKIQGKHNVKTRPFLILKKKPGLL